MTSKTLLIIAALTLGGVTAAQAATPVATPAKTATAPAKKVLAHHHIAAAKQAAPKKS